MSFAATGVHCRINKKATMTRNDVRRILADREYDLLGGARVDLVLRRAVIDDLKETVYGEAIVVVG